MHRFSLNFQMASNGTYNVADESDLLPRKLCHRQVSSSDGDKRCGEVVFQHKANARINDPRCAQLVEGGRPALRSRRPKNRHSSASGSQPKTDAGSFASISACPQVSYQATTLASSKKHLIGPLSASSASQIAIAAPCSGVQGPLCWFRSFTVYAHANAAGLTMIGQLICSGG